MKKILSVILAIALGLSFATIAFAAAGVAAESTSATVTTTVAATTVDPATQGTVVFVLDNGQVNIEVKGTPGKTLPTNPATPSKTGFTFAAWEPAIAGITFPAAGLTTVVKATYVYTEVITTVVVPVTDPILDWVGLLGDEVANFLKDPKVKDLGAKAKEILNKGTTTDIAALADDIVKQVADKTGVDVDTIKGKLTDNEIVRKFMGIYKPATPITTTAAVTEAPTTEAPVIPQTGSAVGGIAIFATLSIAAAAAFVCTKKN